MLTLWKSNLKERLFNLEIENSILKAIFWDLFDEPDKSKSFGLLPFNGQKARTAAITELLSKYSPQCILETGTFLGNTTLLLSKYSEVVKTCEINAALFTHVKRKFQNVKGVTVVNSDSRDFLNNEIPLLKTKRTFCYLDAHWYDDLPLQKEISQLGQIDDIMILIDDFRVPMDDGYGFDKYKKKALDYSLIAEEVQRHSWQAYFPKKPSAEETGSRRGWCLLAKGETATKVATVSDWLQKYLPSKY